MFERRIEEQEEQIRWKNYIFLYPFLRSMSEEKEE